MLYLVGGPARTGKSALALSMLRKHGVPWLSTDIVRTVLGQVVPRIAEVDANDPGPEQLAEVMHPFIERTIDVCLAVTPTYLVEGVEILPADIAGHAARFGETRVCFLGNEQTTAGGLRTYLGDNPWHKAFSDDDLATMAAAIRASSQRLAAQCDHLGYPYVDMGLGYEPGLREGIRALLADSRWTHIQVPDDAHTRKRERRGSIRRG